MDFLDNSEESKVMLCTICFAACKDIQELQEHLCSNSAVQTFASTTVSTESDQAQSHSATEQSGATQSSAIEINSDDQPITTNLNMDFSGDSEDVKVMLCTICLAACKDIQELQEHVCSNSTRQKITSTETDQALSPSTAESNGANQSYAIEINSDDQSIATNLHQDEHSYALVNIADKPIWPSNVEKPASTSEGGEENIFAGMYHCVYCGHVFSEETAFREHSCNKVKDSSKSHTCGKCGKSFGKSSILSAHLKIHNATKEYTCKICSKSFLHKHILVNHELVHSNERPFECGQCGANFKRVAHLRRHELTHSDEKSVACDKCDFKTGSQDSLRRHQINVHTSGGPSFPCTLCPSFFTEKFKLNAHMKHVHNPDKPHKTNKKIQRTVVPCLYCDKKFYWRKHLSTHLQFDHIEEFQKMNDTSEILKKSVNNIETIMGAPIDADPDYNPAEDPDYSALTAEKNAEDEFEKIISAPIDPDFNQGVRLDQIGDCGMDMDSSK